MVLMAKSKLQERVQKNLKQGEEFLDFLANEIQRSSQIKVGLFNLFSPALKEEQERYKDFQQKQAIWTKENFVLRRELLFTKDSDIEQRDPLLSLLESGANTVEGLFDSWEDTVEGHQTTQTNALKVTIPLVAVIISLLSFIIALLK
jgi:hypothetical protein